MRDPLVSTVYDAARCHKRFIICSLLLSRGRFASFHPNLYIFCPMMATNLVGSTPTALVVTSLSPTSDRCRLLGAIVHDDLVSASLSRFALFFVGASFLSEQYHSVRYARSSSGDSLTFSMKSSSSSSPNACDHILNLTPFFSPICPVIRTPPNGRASFYAQMISIAFVRPMSLQRPSCAMHYRVRHSLGICIGSSLFALHRYW